MTESAVAPPCSTTTTTKSTDYKLPSERCTAEDLAENHKLNVRYPEEISMDKFKFNSKTKPPVEGNPVTTTYFTHEDMPFADQEGQRLGMHVVFPKMYVQYLGNKLDPTTGGERGWKMILQPSSAEYWKENNDHNNLVKFLEGLDDKVIEAGFENRKTWFPQEQDLESKADVKKLYKSPLASYGPIENFKEPKYSNSWVDDNGQVITDYKNYTGTKHRKYAPKLYLPLPFGGYKEGEGKYTKTDQLECKFIDGYTGKRMDLRTEDLPEWYKDNREGLQAECIGTLKCVHTDKFKLKMVGAHIKLYTRSGRPSLSSRPLPCGIGFAASQAAVTPPPPEEGQSDTVKKEIKEEKKEDTDQAATPSENMIEKDAALPQEVVVGNVDGKNESNLQSQKAYLATMKRNASMEPIADTAVPPSFKESPRKKVKVASIKMKNAE